MSRLLAAPAWPGPELAQAGVGVAPMPLERITHLLALGDAAALPGPGEVVREGDTRVIWCGHGEALALGEVKPPEQVAAVDQSDGWAAARIEGARRAELLARLCPLDLRPRAFPAESSARSLLGHVHALFVAEEEAILVLVPRSMAGHAAEEVAQALRGLAAREGG
jgi:sarcosine oxidase subunit gamma